MTTPERMKILEMISEGKVSAEEGARLLDAANSVDEPAPAAVDTPRKPAAARVLNTEALKGKRLRVKVVEKNGSRVNVNLPLSLMEVGLRMGGRFVDELNGIDEEMQMLMDAVANEVTGKIVEVDDEDSHVEIYIE